MSYLHNICKEVKQSFEAFSKLLALIDTLIETSTQAQKEIAELKKIVTEERKKHEVVTQQLMDNLCDMVWAKSVPEFRYLYANKAIKELLLHIDNPLGLTDNEIQSMHAGHTVEVVCNKSDVDMWAEYNRRVEAGESPSFTLNFLEHITIKGLDMFLEVRKSMMFDAHGTPIAIVGSGRITNYEAERNAVAGIACADGNMPVCKKHLLKQIDKYCYEPNTSKPIASFGIDELINKYKVA
jgi:hypothetical protein